MPPEIFGDFDAVLAHALDGHGGFDGRASFAVGAARAALIPLHYGEVFVPAREQAIGVGTERVARPAMQNKQHWIGAVAAFDGDPMLDAADANETFFVDGLGVGGPRKEAFD